jgi:hypothetical protein
VALICAYARRYFMKPQYADPEEAATTARECGAKHALGFHWGTFHFWDESIDEPGKRFSSALSTPEASLWVGNLLHQELQGIASNHMTMLSRKLKQYSSIDENSRRDCLHSQL